MAVRESGFKASVKNLRGFLASIDKMGNAYRKLTQEQEKLARNAAKSGKRVDDANRRQTSSFSRLKNAYASIGNAQRRLQNAEITHQKLLESKKRNVDAIIKAHNNEKNAVVDVAKAQETYYQAVIQAVGATKKVEDAVEDAEQAQDDFAESTEDSGSAFLGLASLAPQAAAALLIVGAAFGALLAIIDKVVSALTGFAKVLVSVVKGALDTVKNVITGFGGALSKLIAPIKNFIARVAEVATGILLASAVRSIFNELRDAIGGMIETLSELQRRTIQLSALAARDFAKTYGGTIADAFEKTSGKAQELLEWVKQIAVSTPFSAQAVLNMLAMANSFGINIELSKHLTRAIIDFASGMGLQSDQMERIIYNFGQMIAIGKLTGREFRDLSTSFVPVELMLEEMAKDAGVAKEEFRAMALSGGLPVLDFIEKFIEVAERDFPGAAEKMARTFSGVIERIKTFFQLIIGLEMFGPLFDRLTGLAADVLDKLLDPEIQKKAGMIGEVMLEAFERVYESIQKDLIPALTTLGKAFGLPDISAKSLIKTLGYLTGTFTSLASKFNEFVTQNVDKFAKGFDGIADKARGWGANITAQLAAGMAAGAKMIVKVINAISRLISGWLSGKSPPRFLPNIVKWGINAMEQFMKGWSLVDFNVFGDIADKIEGYLRAIPSQIFDEKKLVPTIVKMRLAVAQAVEEIRKFGDISAATFDKVKKAVGGLPGEFYKYIRSLLEYQKITHAVEQAQQKLADAQERVKRIQDQLNSVNKHYSAILDDLQRQLSAVTDEFDDQARLNKINAALATNLLTEEERARLEAEKRSLQIKQQIRDTEDARDAELDVLDARLSAADAEALRVQTHLEGLQKEQKLMKEQLDTYAAMIDIYTENQGLLSEYLDLLDSLKKSGSDAADAMTGAFEAVEDVIDDVVDGYENLYDLVDRLANYRGDDEEDSFMDQFLEGFAQAEKDIDEIIKNIIASFGDLTGPGGIIGDLTDEISGLFDILFGKGMTPEQDPTGAWEGYTSDSLVDKIKEFGEAFEKFAEKFKTTVNPELEILKNHLIEIATNLAELYGGDTDIETLGDAMILFADQFLEFTNNLLALIEAITEVMTIFDRFTPGEEMDFGDSLLGGGFENAFEMMVPGIIEAIFDVTFGLIEENIKVLQETLPRIGEKILKFWEELKPKIAEKLDNIKTAIGTKLREWLPAISPELQAIIDGIVQFFQDLWDDLVGESIIPEMMDDIYDAIIDKMEEIRDIIPEKLEEWKQAFVDWIAPFLLWLEERWEAFKLTTTTIWDEIGTYFDTKLQEIAGFFKTLKQTALDPLIASFKALINFKKPFWWPSAIPWPFDSGHDWIDNSQFGGRVNEGGTTVVGEAGRELFVPASSGYIVPNNVFETAIRALAGTVSAGQATVGAQSVAGYSSVTNNFIEINPTYSQVAQPVRIYQDVTAALAVVSR